MDHSGHGKGMDHSGHGGMDHSGHGAMPGMNDIKMDHTHDMTMTSEMMHDMGGMSMSFHFGYNEVILFDWWTIDSIGGLIGSMIGIFVFSMLYEGLKYWREHLMRRAIAKQQYVANGAKPNCEENKQIQVNMLSAEHAIQTLLHVLQMVMSYFLMLIFMTYNVWLCIAVILGAAVGYFLFGWRKSVVVDITEHCH